ncbi:unnamed protein product [Phaedon cochleariae]|uniref:Uncharacterized protein n=1 Tax=Phaedon cochleariae TaxID=80249 RepID=A0A9P0DQN5_PHACE|nr:unnamed protein product [Phaedon cochleariae]
MYVHGIIGNILLGAQITDDEFSGKLSVFSRPHVNTLTLEDTNFSAIKMRVTVIVLCLYFSLGYSAEQNNTCGLTNPIQDLTEIVGVWYEYKKTPSFLGNDNCTSFDMICPNVTYCEVEQMNFKTNTSKDSYILKLNISTKIITWEDEVVNIAWTEKDLALVVRKCDKEKEQLAVYTKNVTLSDDTAEKKIEAYIKSLNYKGSNLTLINNTLCNSAMITTTTAFLLFSIIIFAIY